MEWPKSRIHHNLPDEAKRLLEIPLRTTHDGQKKRITALNRRRRSVKFSWFVTNDEHWDFRPIFTLIPDLRGLEVIWIQSIYLCRPKDAETLRLCSCEVVVSNGPRRVKSGEREEEMRLFLSVRYRCNANKVRRQTCKLNALLRIEVYFIFYLWMTYRR